VIGIREARIYPNLKLQLWRRGIRQNWLAQELGIDESALSRIVNGFRQPSAETRARIAALLASEESWLFEAQKRGQEN
jgi:transcriptional regulator with XRE-family HTH domain